MFFLVSSSISVSETFQLFRDFIAENTNGVRNR
jgi:hypothetical protein